MACLRDSCGAMSNNPSLATRTRPLLMGSVLTCTLTGVWDCRPPSDWVTAPLRVPGGVWTAGLTIALYVVILGIIVGTQPGLAVGAAVILGVLLVAGVVAARYARAETAESID